MAMVSIMPELFETEASARTVEKIFKDNPQEDWKVEAIAADGTTSERKRAPKNSPLKRGLVTEITASSKPVMKRGPKNAQTNLFPPMWLHKNSPQISSLRLQGISHGARALILNFGSLWMKFQYLTHSSPQFYKRADWDSRIALVDRESRGNKIALAVIFKNYVLAFLSNDLVFQVTWSETLVGLNPFPADILKDKTSFLNTLVDWIKARDNGRCDRSLLATQVVREANHVWAGVGVYTVNELFFMAGLSPFLTECEVFDVPSRVARLVEAYYAYCHRSVNDVWELIRPALHDGILAPTREQRLKYITWLHVYGKKRSYMPPRMKELVDIHKHNMQLLAARPTPWTRRNSEHIFDIFEPTFIEVSLKQKENLGHLIFGKDDWHALGGTEPTRHDDPLSVHFMSLRNDCEFSTFLRNPLTHYSPLFVAKKELRITWCPTYTYRAKKQLWSITELFPRNSYETETLDHDSDGDLDSLSDSESAVESGSESGIESSSELGSTSAEIRQITGPARERMTLEYIITKTNGVGIGPLEYCGNGHIVKQNGGGGATLALCRHDPGVDPYVQLRQEYRVLKKVEGQKKAQPEFLHRQQEVDNEMKTKRETLRRSILGDSQAGNSSMSADSAVVQGIKRRRACTDVHLVSEFAGPFLGKRTRRSLP
ncbi:hypothetical protein SCHPADRAFT_939128 [Schizopora paradoxa]|uniref:Uncharacterized protein n=1 Tax=Schizopora paradoxa TaxID=27342 RepID=A0A0H2SDG9_9AGAM|nr:hypothetical protein SCHPADRAFT_939128 [Schizopora paradoxa]